MRAPAEPLHLAIDDIAAAKMMTFNRASSILGVWPFADVIYYAAAALFGVSGLQMLSTHWAMPFFAHRFVVGWMYLGLAVLYFVQARWLYGGPKALVIPTDITANDDGILYSRRGAPETVVVAWKRVRSVRKVADGFIMMVSWRITRRIIFVPKPADESLGSAIWAMCYEHMVPRRGLVPSSPDRLGVIENTAAA
jgi:hypothetical protein